MAEPELGMYLVTIAQNGENTPNKVLGNDGSHQLGL